MRRRLSVLLATALMLAMMLATAGVASAAPGNNGQGAAHASSKASFGIATAIQNSTKNDECTGCNPL